MNNKRELELLDQIIEKAQKEDEAHKQRAIRAGKGSKALGESWMLFHLRTLRELISNK
tara:strand:- start:493 stop:666 length:174 start_codon:yes stop_codon:yes gene_type:complete